MKKVRIARSRHCLMLSAVCLFAVSPAHAVDKEYYVGASVGPSVFDYQPTSFGTSSTESSQTGVSAAVGYQPTRHFTFEASYYRFGESEFSKSGSTVSAGVPLTVAMDGSLTSSGLGVLVVGSMYARNFDFFFRAGVLYSDTSVSATRVITGTPPGQLTPSTQTIVIDESEQNAALMYGAGVGYTIAAKYNINVAYTNVLDGIDVENAVKGDVGMIALGFNYRF